MDQIRGSRTNSAARASWWVPLALGTNFSPLSTPHEIQVWAPWAHPGPTGHPYWPTKGPIGPIGPYSPVWGPVLVSFMFPSQKTIRGLLASMQAKTTKT